jgi:hypothetical protein
MPREAKFFGSSAGSAVRGYLKFRANIPASLDKKLRVVRGSASSQRLPRASVRSSVCGFAGRGHGALFGTRRANCARS